MVSNNLCHSLRSIERKNIPNSHKDITTRTYLVEDSYKHQTNGKVASRSVEANEQTCRRWLAIREGNDTHRCTDIDGKK